MARRLAREGCSRAFGICAGVRRVLGHGRSLGSRAAVRARPNRRGHPPHPAREAPEPEAARKRLVHVPARLGTRAEIRRQRRRVEAGRDGRPRPMSAWTRPASDAPRRPMSRASTSGRSPRCPRPGSRDADGLPAHRLARRDDSHAPRPPHLVASVAPGHPTLGHGGSAPECATWNSATCANRNPEATQAHQCHSYRLAAVLVLASRGAPWARRLWSSRRAWAAGVDGSAEMETGLRRAESIRAGPRRRRPVLAREVLANRRRLGAGRKSASAASDPRADAAAGRAPRAFRFPHSDATRYARIQSS